MNSAFEHMSSESSSATCCWKRAWKRGVACLLAGFFVCIASGVGAQTEAPSKSASLLAAVDEFVQLMRGDPELAVDLMMSAEASIRFEAGGAMVPVALRYFSHGIIPFTQPLDGDVALIGFYHPWSDVILLSEWRLSDPQRWMIVDCELVPADFIREGGEPPYDLLPRWRRPGLSKLPPEAVIKATDEAAASFDAVFRDARPGVWRDEIHALHTPEMLAVGSALAVRRLRDVIATLTLLKQRGRPTHLGRSLQELLTQALDSGLETMDSKTGISSGVKALPRKTWEHAQLLAVAPLADGAFVFLTAPGTRSCFISGCFQDGKEGARLLRMDLLSLEDLPTPQTAK